MNPNYPKQLTASGFVLNTDRQVLLVHHRKLGVWLYPGGHVDDNETPDAAVLREIFEETGIRARIVGALDTSLEDREAGIHVLHTPYRVMGELIQSPDDPHYHIDLIYICAALSQDCTINDEVHEARFFTHDEVRKLKLFPSFCVLLDRVFSDESLWRSIMEIT